MAERLLHLDGKPFSLRDYPFFYGVYNTDAREVLLKTSRQIGKSSYCANLMVTDTISTPHFKVLYVTPSRSQTSKFSNTRLSKVIGYSPLIRKNYIRSDLTRNVFLQLLKNGSYMELNYACDDPDRIRSATADRVLIDEVQDVHYDAVIPVVKECMSASAYAYMSFAGTPKTTENTIEFLWKRSTQCEWIMKCTGCNEWQFISSPQSIGEHGAICVKCSKSLNVRDGQWYSFNPTAKLAGFHVSQPMLPINNENQERWDRLLEKLDTYSESKFANECLGISDAIGSRFVSQEELLALCEDYYVDEPPIPSDLREDCQYVTGGVDWSGGGSEIVSRTVVWVFGLDKTAKLKTLYFKVFPSNNPIQDVEDVAKVFNACRCDVIVGDAGEGAVANSYLRRALGAHRMFQAQYGSFGKLIRWNNKDRYLVDRTAAIDTYMSVLKNQGVIFPNKRQSAIPIQDILNEYEESTQSGIGAVTRKLWRHALTAPDDCLHAQIFAWLAMKMARHDLEFYSVD